MPERPIQAYEFGGFRLNVGERLLERQSERERIAISEKAFRTLVHLVRNSGALVTKEAILAAVWPGVVVEEGNIGKVIHAIRRALGDEGGLTYIETVPKHGYRFVAEVTILGRSASTTGSAGALGVNPVALGRSPAYDLYIRGKVKTGGENADDANEAIALLEAPVERDPSWAPHMPSWNVDAKGDTNLALLGDPLHERAGACGAVYSSIHPKPSMTHTRAGFTSEDAWSGEQSVRSTPA